MAEVRKFDSDAGDDLQKQVRAQIGDTVMPAPPGPSATTEHDSPNAEEETAAAFTDLGAVDSFLFYGDQNSQQ